MNLADAIRKAALASSHTQLPNSVPESVPASAPDSAQASASTNAQDLEHDATLRRAYEHEQITAQFDSQTRTVTESRSASLPGHDHDYLEPQPESETDPYLDAPEDPVVGDTDIKAFAQPARVEHDVASTDAPIPPSGPVTAVRLELFLAPEQVSNLMRSIVASQHSVMTIREAAAFLRISSLNLEQLATDRAVPGFQVDGRWRFSRTALEEWLSEQGRNKEAAS